MLCTNIVTQGVTTGVGQAMPSNVRLLNDPTLMSAVRENIMNLGSARFPKHEHAQKYERILECLHELEAGVRETAQSNNKYAAELDMHQLLVNKMQPELEAADEKMQDLEQRLEFSLRKVALLEKENADQP